jgi:RHS repeat-associated protein
MELSYDPAGNVTYDNSHSYLYDGTPVNRSTSTGWNTYGLHFYFNDPLPGSPATGLRRWGGLGTRRAQTDYAGVLEQSCASLPFGDGLTCSGGNLQAPTEHHFTGKERDSESGNDYFGARYYSSAMGRWMSPDPGGPNPSNPQALNLYRYGFNNPLRYTDPDGFYERDVHFDLTQVLAYAAGYSSAQSSMIARADQGVDDSPVTGPFVGYGARRDFHFTTAERRAEMWNFAWNENGLGTYLHSEQDSYSHAGFGPGLGHLFAGHAPDKTYNDPSKADLMANDTYRSLIEAGPNMWTGTEAGAIPYLEIMPFVQAFNRATTKKDKDRQIDLLRQHVDQYRKDHKDDKGNDPPDHIGTPQPGYCAPEFSHC